MLTVIQFNPLTITAGIVGLLFIAGFIALAVFLLRKPK
jgi:hypothetical protein